MSALVTHLLVGALLALALKWEWKWVPLGAVLAELPDLDHFGPLEPRVHLHNVAFAFVLPLAFLAVLAWQLGRRRLMDRPHARTALTIAAGAPVLVSAHLVLDLVPQEIGGTHMALLYPFSDRIYESGYHVGPADPFTWSTLSVALAGVVVLVAAGHGLRVAAFRWATSAASHAAIPVRIGKPARHIHRAEADVEA